jgi:cell division protein FtsB
MKFMIFIASLFALLIILQYQLWFGEGSYQQLWQRQQQITEQLKNNQSLEEKNALLAAEVADLKQGFTAIEERARRELGMIKEGEVYYQIVK